jgi:hypothetical protein
MNRIHAGIGKEMRNITKIDEIFKNAELNYMDAFARLTRSLPVSPVHSAIVGARNQALKATNE